MIQEIITHRCRFCDIVKNGHNAQYWCKECNKCTVLRTGAKRKRNKYSGYIIYAQACKVCPACSVSIDSTYFLAQKKDQANTALEEIFLPVQENNVLELDEM